MDDRRFDALVRSLAVGRSRRQVLKGLLGLGGAVAAATVVSDTEAARRPTPTPRPEKRCPGQQTLQDGQCTCPPNTDNCGPECCPAGAQCCSGACCYGQCYGEELCCPSSQDWCEATGECCAPGSVCCGASGCQAACCVPSCDGSTCGGDGCGGSCSCDGGKICSAGLCVCPAGTMECSDGTCNPCCELLNMSSECVATQGGDAGCWACSLTNGPGTSARSCGAWTAGCPIPNVGTGYCGAEDHLCYPYKANGASCSANRECSSGYCLSGVCANR